MNSLDAHDWIDAGSLFLQALRHHDWAGTYVGGIAAHPGVTVMWVVALLHAVHLAGYSEVFFCVLRLSGLLGSWYLLRPLVAKQTWLLIGTYWLIHPQLVWGSTTTWLDQLFTWFFTLTLIFFVRVLSGRTRHNWWLTGLFFGLALLTKVAAFFLLPILALLLAPFPYKKVLLHTIFAVLFAVGIYVCLYPAMWISPSTTPFHRIVSSQLKVDLQPQIVATRWWYYPTRLASVDPFLAGIALFFIMSRSSGIRQLNPSWKQFGMASGLFMLMVFLVSVSLTDPGNGPQAFLAGSARYLAPAIPLASATVIVWLRQALPSRSFWLLMGCSMVFALIRWPLSPLAWLF